VESTYEFRDYLEALLPQITSNSVEYMEEVLGYTKDNLNQTNTQTENHQINLPMEAYPIEVEKEVGQDNIHTNQTNTQAESDSKQNNTYHSKHNVADDDSQSEPNQQSHDQYSSQEIVLIADSDDSSIVIVEEDNSGDNKDVIHIQARYPKQQCKHRCKNKATCVHSCCKDQVEESSYDDSPKTASRKKENKDSKNLKLKKRKRFTPDSPCGHRCYKKNECGHTCCKQSVTHTEASQEGEISKDYSTQPKKKLKLSIEPNNQHKNNEDDEGDKENNKGKDKGEIESEKKKEKEKETETKIQKSNKKAKEHIKKTPTRKSQRVRTHPLEFWTGESMIVSPLGHVIISPGPNQLKDNKWNKRQKLSSTPKKK